MLVFKNRVDMQSCGNYKEIKLMSYTEKLNSSGLRADMSICEQQCMRYMQRIGLDGG